MEKRIENVFSWNYFSIEKHFMLNKRGLKLEITIFTSSGMPCWLSDSTNMRTNINIYREKERERVIFKYLGWYSTSIGIFIGCFINTL